MNNSAVITEFLSDIGVVTNEQARAILNYGGKKVTLPSLKAQPFEGTHWHEMAK